jgi:hypothetical protein
MRREMLLPAIYPALMLAFNAGMRSGEVRKFTTEPSRSQAPVLGRWQEQDRGWLRTHDSTQLNAPLDQALKNTQSCILSAFGHIEPDWYLFPFGRGNQREHTRAITTIKTAWGSARERGREWTPSRFET